MTIIKNIIPQVAARMDETVGEAIERAAQTIAADARQRVPRGPGDIHLHDAIRVLKASDTEYAVVAGDDEAWYGHIVEFGSSATAKRPWTTPPRPFLIPAMEAHRRNAIKQIDAAIDRLAKTGHS